MQGNPYGAVPDALKETRLTLRDLMADHLANKVAEGRLNLAKLSAETETAMVGANLKKEEMVNLRDLTRLKQQDTQFEESRAQRAGEFEQTMGLQERGQALQATAQQDANAIAKGHLGVAQAGEERARREENRKNEVKTAGEWVTAAGMNKGILDFMGVDPNQKFKRADAEALYGTLQTTMKSNPSLGFMAYGYTLRGELTNLQEQLRNPNLPPAQAAELRKKYDASLAKFETLDKLIMAEKTPDQAKIVESARRTWTDNSDLSTKYKNFDAFLTDFQRDVTKVRGVFQEDIGKLKTNAEKKSPADIEAAIKGINTIVSDIKAGKYGLDPRNVAIIQKMTQAVQMEKAPQILDSLQRIVKSDAAERKAPVKAAANTVVNNESNDLYGALPAAATQDQAITLPSLAASRKAGMQIRY